MLARHFSIFSYEDLSFRKEFGKRLYLLGFRNGDPIVRLARSDKINRWNAYYLMLCDEFEVKIGPKTTIRLQGEPVRCIKRLIPFSTGRKIEEVVKPCTSSMKKTF